MRGSGLRPGIEPQRREGAENDKRQIMGDMSAMTRSLAVVGCLVVLNALGGCQTGNPVGTTNTILPFGGALAVRESSLGKLLPGVVSHTVTVSPDNNHVAYMILKGGESFVVLDGKPSPSYGRIGSPVFSPDGKRVLYSEKQAKKRPVVIDGKPVSHYEWLYESSPAFSPDSKHVYYFAIQSGKAFVVIDGRPSTKFDGLDGIAPVISPDSQHVAYDARKSRDQIRSMPMYGQGRWSSARTAVTWPTLQKRATNNFWL